MSQQRNDLKPLFLSAEEAMGLLDLCMLSRAEFDCEKEGVLLKLSDLVRVHLAVEDNQACAVVRVDGEDARSEPSQEDLRYVDNGRSHVSGAEPVAVKRNAAHRTVSKPCPAGRFRSMTAGSGV